MYLPTYDLPTSADFSYVRDMAHCMHWTVIPSDPHAATAYSRLSDSRDSRQSVRLLAKVGMFITVSTRCGVISSASGSIVRTILLIMDRLLV